MIVGGEQCALTITNQPIVLCVMLWRFKSIEENRKKPASIQHIVCSVVCRLVCSIHVDGGCVNISIPITRTHTYIHLSSYT